MKCGRGKVWWVNGKAASRSSRAGSQLPVARIHRLPFSVFRTAPINSTQSRKNTGRLTTSGHGRRPRLTTLRVINRGADKKYPSHGKKMLAASTEMLQMSKKSGVCVCRETAEKWNLYFCLIDYDYGLHISCTLDMNSAIAEMAAQSCTIRIFAVKCG